MKKLSLFNNVLILFAVLVDLVLLFKNIPFNGLSYNLICISFLVILFVPKILKCVFKVKVNPFIEFVYLVFVVLAQLFGSMLHFYSEIHWYDSFTHFLSGVLTAFLSIIILDKLRKYNSKDIVFNIIFIFAITLMVASLWEIFEFSSDKILGGDTQKVLLTGVDDTMKDIICALFGSVVFVVCYLYDLLKNKKYLEKFL